jgi:muramoyltetrapeptide carboxypeptidase LdcA involved in peptidoglycan recycling
MRYPKDLAAGGKIGFLAPSFGCSFEPYYSAFQNALKRFEARGYQLHLGPNCFVAEGVGISNTPQKCAAEVMEMFASDADALISCGGGELMCEVLSHVSFEELAKCDPKWYIGYSDNTNLTYLLTTLTDTASIYGPCASSFGMEPLHPALEDALSLMTGKLRKVSSYGMWEDESFKGEENPLAPYNTTEVLDMKRFVGNTPVGEEEPALTFSGRLIGGCTDCLVNLLGTRFDQTTAFVEKYKEDGFVWFLESCDLNVYAMRRAMWQMKEAGWFRYVKGLLVGRPANGAEIFGLNRYDAILKVAGEWNVPVIMDVDLGHRPPMMPLITGSYATVCAGAKELSIEMECR